MKIRTFLAWTLLELISTGVGIKWATFEVPQWVRIGQNTSLLCRFDLEGQSLYAVKWYKDGREIYRYVPAQEASPQQNFEMPGVTIDLSKSDTEVLRLQAVSLQTSGRYKCEVLAESPHFMTLVKSDLLTVVDLPKGHPRLSGGKSRYQVGDKVNLSCQSPPSIPPAKITWFVNGMKTNIYGNLVRPTERLKEYGAYNSQRHFVHTKQHVAKQEVYGNYQTYPSYKYPFKRDMTQQINETEKNGGLWKRDVSQNDYWTKFNKNYNSKHYSEEERLGTKLNVNKFLTDYPSTAIPTFYTNYQTESHPDFNFPASSPGRKSVVDRLQFTARSWHFLAGNMTIRCEAKIFNFWRGTDQHVAKLTSTIRPALLGGHFTGSTPRVSPSVTSLLTMVIALLTNWRPIALASIDP